MFYRESGERYSINRVVIEQKVHEIFILIKEKIKVEIRNKPLMLMVDITTKHNISILGVNIRFWHENKFIMRTIGMEHLKKSHTAQNVYELIIELLDQYEIKPIQIFVYVSDNAKNVTNVSILLNDDCEDYMFEEGINIDDKIFQLANDENSGIILEEVEKLFMGNNCHVISLSCAAHTTQLAVCDALKSPDILPAISKVKDVVKDLRTPTIASVIREKKLNQAIIDHPIRWAYKYQMV